MEEDLEYLLYTKLCNGCPNQKRCHDECTQCEEYLEILEEQGEQ